MKGTKNSLITKATSLVKSSYFYEVNLHFQVIHLYRKATEALIVCVYVYGYSFKCSCISAWHKNNYITRVSYANGTTRSTSTTTVPLARTLQSFLISSMWPSLGKWSGERLILIWLYLALPPRKNDRHFLWIGCWTRIWAAGYLKLLKATISVKTNEKFESPLPPFQWWKKKSAFWFAREFIIDMGGEGGFISHFIPSKIVVFCCHNGYYFRG